jgi:hypothetical protein
VGKMEKIKIKKVKFGQNNKWVNVKKPFNKYYINNKNSEGILKINNNLLFEIIPELKEENKKDGEENKNLIIKYRIKNSNKKKKEIIKVIDDKDVDYLFPKFLNDEEEEKEEEESEVNEESEKIPKFDKKFNDNNIFKFSNNYRKVSFQGTSKTILSKIIIYF